MAAACCVDRSQDTPRTLNPKQSFAFVFPMMPGDLNPSLPVARELVSRGHAVHYLEFEQFRDAIEDTGATFHSAIKYEQELYEGRHADIFGAFTDLKKEYGLEADGPYAVRIKLNNVSVEKQLPGLLRFYEEIGANVVIYDPVVCREAAVAAAAKTIPTVALLAFAGPGGWEDTVRLKLANEKKTPEQFDEMTKNYQPNLDAIKRLNETYGLSLEPEFSFGKLDPIPKVTIVTTTQTLKHSETAELTKAYEAKGARNEYVGPLLDKSGAKRAGTFKVAKEDAKSDEAKPPADSITELLAKAKGANRPIIFASMGTVTTGDDQALGWNGRPNGKDGKPRGLTGRQLCQSAWAGVFDAFGADGPDEGPLILLTVGPQSDPLGSLKAPPNAICRPFMPQVDILKAGAAAFLTHGGQNSFMEALSQATPVLVCPTAGDQFDNAKKAEELGVGLDAGRPDSNPGEEEAAMKAHRDSVAAKLKAVSRADGRYKQAVDKIAQELASAGGVPRAADIVLAASKS